MADYDKENFTKIIRLIINDDAKIIAANLRPSSFSYLNITLLSICVIAIGVMVYLGRKTQHILTNKSVIQKIEKIEPSIEEQVDQILLQRFKNESYISETK
jgi:hypothetical protein